MTRRRRAALMIGLAVVLAALAASDVGRREAALRDAVGPLVAVVVAEQPLRGGEPVDRKDLTVRHVPERYAPADRVQRPEEIAGLRPRVSVPAGADLSPQLVEATAGPRLRPGERIADLVVIGDRRQVQPGTRVDLLVTEGEGGKGGKTQLMLENAEVLGVRDLPDGGGEETSGERIAVQLRTTQRQALELTEAQNFASELRVLVRAPDDDRTSLPAREAGR